MYETGYHVVALVIDLGSTNGSLRKDLNVGINKKEKSFFIHPVNSDLKVFVFADLPHLLKLVRNNLVDSGFHYNDIHIDFRCLEEIISLNKHDLKISYKLEQKHLDVKGVERQKVSTAAQVLSDTTAHAVHLFGLNKFLKSENWEVCANFFKAVNDWFDVFNSSQKFRKTPVSCAYGVDLKNQEKALDLMSFYMENFKVGNYKSLISFQKGYILNNDSLKELLLYLKQKYNSQEWEIQYILTRRINQDVIENFFSYIRGMGASHDKPSALQFRYRLRWYILGRHSSDLFVENANTEEDISL